MARSLFRRAQFPPDQFRIPGRLNYGLTYVCAEFNRNSIVVDRPEVPVLGPWDVRVIAVLAVVDGLLSWAQPTQQRPFACEKRSGASDVLAMITAPRKQREKVVDD